MLQTDTRLAVRPTLKSDSNTQTCTPSLSKQVKDKLQPVEHRNNRGQNMKGNLSLLNLFFSDLRPNKKTWHKWIDLPQLYIQMLN